MDLTPLIPFEPVSTNKIPSGEQWIAQMKWDGVRMLTYCAGGQVKLFNRRLNERTLQYPELLQPSAYCRSASFIVDGELIAFDENKPSFHEIMKRDSLRKQQSIAIAVSRTPVTYMIFDVLYADGKWVTDKTLLQRQQILQSMIIPQDNIQIVQNFNNGAQLLDVMRSHGMEGIVCKNTASNYAISGKDNRWQKIKIFHDLHAAVGGVTLRDNIVNSLLLGLYDQSGAFVYIGHTGPGRLTGTELIELTNRFIPMTVPSMPFSNTPERHKDALWLKPEAVVKVQYMEWTPNHTMRHPTLQAMMKEIPAKDCTFGQLL